MDYLLITTGAGLGGLSRALLMSVLPTSFSGIPLRVLSVNIIGSFLIGLVASHCNLEANLIRHFIITGFLGGFTTFSSFVFDFSKLAEAGQFWLGVIYLTISVIGGILAFYLAWKVI